MFKYLKLEQQWDNPTPQEFTGMLLKESCLLAEHLFLVECHRAAEKGFFSWRALKNSRKHTLRETSFICYANLESTWLATGSRVPPGSGTVSLVFGRHPLCLWFTGWISVVLYSSPLKVGLIETWLWLSVTMLFSSNYCPLCTCLGPFDT